jgi:hypothetical protein
VGRALRSLSLPLDCLHSARYGVPASVGRALWRANPPAPSPQKHFLPQRVLSLSPPSLQIFTDSVRPRESSEYSLRRCPIASSRHLRGPSSVPGPVGFPELGQVRMRGPEAPGTGKDATSNFVEESWSRQRGEVNWTHHGEFRF